MKKIESYAELSPLLANQLCRGVRTNAFASREEYEKEIAAGRLFAEEYEGGLLLLRERESHFRLNFYLKELKLPALCTEKPLVTEIAAREKDLPLWEAAEFLEGQGFSLDFRRRRLRREAGLAEEGTCPVCRASAPDAEQITALFAACFDENTGCLPTKDELAELIKEGKLLCVKDGGVAGLLHFEKGRASAEIRHLAVLPAYRKKGFAQALFSAFAAETKGLRSTVWVRRGNTPAEKFYEKNGYAPDGWTSAVLIKKG